jgi:5-oxoprolinase (ATP-hydrolysing)
MAVGPESAGSYPGPACYGFGGPLTVTDANLYTGRLIPEYFPNTFGPDRNAAVDTDIVGRMFADLAVEINSSTGVDLSPFDVADGFLRVADEKMAMAIKEISVSRGFDVRDYALVSFGGAGGQHACSIAELLDIDTIIIHPLNSVMSAYGIGLSKPVLSTAKTVLEPFNREKHDEMAHEFDVMENRLAAKAGGEIEKSIIKREIDLRPAGAETFLTLEYRNYEETLKDFAESYERLFGFRIEDNSPLEITNVRVEIHESEEFFVSYREGSPELKENLLPAFYQEMYFAGRIIKAPVYLREDLPEKIKLEGHAIILDRNSTIVIDKGFEAERNEAGLLFLKRVSEKRDFPPYYAGNPDPVHLEVFSNTFMGIANEMGLTLKHTAYSVNMKERLDFSCAIFDSKGNLVANAQHIPVHLGAMSDTVKSVLEKNRGAMEIGDVYLSNNPFNGGSHLSDMTVVCPVFSDNGDLVFLTAARGHHSDVGGTTPGSMPPTACHIDEEGVLIDNFLLVRDGKLREYELIDILSTHAFPVRNIRERILDFRAQIAACKKGINELNNISGKYGLKMVLDYMEFIQVSAEYTAKKVLSQFIEDRGFFYGSFEDFLDDGTPIKASLTIHEGSKPPDTIRATIDFSGTGPQHNNDSLNAPLSVSRSAVMYVLRVLMDKDIPLNSGCLNPVEVIIPEGTILNPRYPAPVATGNVETSQRIVDVLLGAFGIAAASQGTMNNFLFEVEGDHPYYETIAGGSGASKDCPGASGVQVHMTNTQITDPEILEFRHRGVRLERFILRRKSGGRGEFPGGDGVVREIIFLSPATVSILSERRTSAPYGLKGGGPGKSGCNLHKDKEGKITELGHRVVTKLNTNESIIIKTPGGGGFGR